MNSVNGNQNTSIFLSCLLITSIYLNAYYIVIGFSLKPYIIISALIFILTFYKIHIHYLRLFEINILVFFIFYCATGIFSKYPLDSIRLIMAIIIVLIVYFIMRFVFSSISISKLEKAISISGIVFNLLSLTLYAYGAFKLNFYFIGNGIQSYGLLIDRNVPRLTGTFTDPNIFAFGSFIFFYYYLTHLKEKGTKIGLILSAITLLLTFSRGAYLAVLIGLAILLLISKTNKKVKILLLGPPVLYFLVTWTSKLFNLSILQIVVNRFKESITDNGSGRLDIWNNGLTLFADKPFFGIGIHNFRSYSNDFFNMDFYMHNTFLEVLTEAGIIGFCLYINIFLLMFFDLYIYRKSTIDTRYLIVTLISMLICMSSLSLVANEVFFLITAIIWRYLFEIEKNRKKLKTPEITGI